MNITTEVLRINGFEKYPLNTEYLYRATKDYKILIYPKIQPNSNICICNVDVEYYSEPFKDQKMNIKNIKTINDLDRIFKMFNISIDLI